MPLVRIDIHVGRTPDQLTALADAIHEVLLEHFAAPPGDRYQIVSEHPPGHLFIEDTGLGLQRTQETVVIQILQQGRNDMQKKALYAALASTLQTRVGLHPSDLMVAIASNTGADWSFGLGRAQFLEGDL